MNESRTTSYKPFLSSREMVSSAEPTTCPLFDQGKPDTVTADTQKMSVDTNELF